MKKLFTIAAVAVLGMTSVNAQDINFGAKAGVNFATITGDETDGIESQTGFHVGVVAEIMISEKFSFQPELLYSAQGASDTFEDEFDKEEYTIKYDYINLPLMAKYYVAEGFSIEAGPQIGFLINSEAEYEYTNKEFPEFNESETNDIKDFTNSIDFGVNFGLGYKLESGLNFGARYNLGLSNVNDGEGSDDLKNQNAVFQVSVGFFF
ncbi:porin family protein [Olleya sp. AS48]|uniref:porin family protein n=1 Tax=Olleya sp. AS48 TaxID=3135774 RepID=UPI0030DCC67C|tara:strand:+ start:76294 stop:76917 length:624 start_codon:yes stop_codon:yes gene_type:complete